MAEYYILTLPEPNKSRALAALGMTEDEFRRNMDGHIAANKEREEAIARGDAEPSNLHPDEDLPMPTILDRS